MTPRAILLLLPLAAACGDDACPLVEDVVPGCGVLVGGEPMRIGDALANLEERFGEPALQELSSLGTRFDYAPSGVTGFCGPDGLVGSLMLGPRFRGGTAGGVMVGAGEEVAGYEFGEAVPDPLGAGLWYPEEGIGVEVEETVVARIHVFAPEEGW